MADALAPAAREHDWSRIAFALAAFLVVPQLLWAVVPVKDTQLLLVPAMAACFIAGWLAGGSLLLAMAWTALSAVQVVMQTRDATSAYFDLARGWGLLVAGAFGVVCVIGSGRRFLTRALAAIGLATLFALILAAVGRLDVESARRVFAEQFAMRSSEIEAAARLWEQQLLASAPPFGEWLARQSEKQAEFSRALSSGAAWLFPALLALEALAACALAWALYHRLSRSRLGPPLGTLRDLTFSDQLVWGFIAGLVLVLLPSLSPLSMVGANLLFFFAALYALRGLGVVAWWAARAGLRSRWIVAGGTLVLVALTPASEIVLFVVGLGDTWNDWRGLSKKAAPSPRGSL